MRRLHILECRAAVLGINAPAELVIEIEDLSMLIQKLDHQRQFKQTARYEDGDGYVQQHEFEDVHITILGICVIQIIVIRTFHSATEKL